MGLRLSLAAAACGVSGLLPPLSFSGFLPHDVLASGGFFCYMLFMRYKAVINSLVFTVMLLGGSWAAGFSAIGGAVIPVADPVKAVRAIALRTQDDRPFRFSELLGRVVVLNFVYTGCGTTCPTQTQSLAAVQAAIPMELRSRIAFVSVSVDPEHDTPATLRDFASRHGADLSNWVFLTGRPDQVRAVSAFFGGFSPAPGRDPVINHLAVLQLFDARGEGVLRYAGDPVDEARLLADLRAVAAPTTNPLTAPSASLPTASP